MSAATEKGIPLIVTGTVAASNTVREGASVKYSSGNFVEAVAGSDKVVGVAYASESGVWPAPAGSKIQIALLGSQAIVRALAGTGGFSQGDFVKAVAGGGVTTATVGNATPTNVITVVGQAIETVAAGELGGVNLGVSAPTVGS